MASPSDACALEAGECPVLADLLLLVEGGVPDFPLVELAVAPLSLEQVETSFFQSSRRRDFNGETWRREEIGLSDDLKDFGILPEERSSGPSCTSSVGPNEDLVLASSALLAEHVDCSGESCSNSRTSRFTTIKSELAGTFELESDSGEMVIGDDVLRACLVSMSKLESAVNGKWAE